MISVFKQENDMIRISNINFAYDLIDIIKPSSWATSFNSIQLKDI